MATASMVLPVKVFDPSDGSANNAAPGFAMIKGTAADPKGFFGVYQFDPATAEYLNFAFPMPSNYAAGGAVSLNIKWMANSASGNSVVWAAKLGATSEDDADTIVEHAYAAASSVTSAANASEARRQRTATISMANLDNLAAGDAVKLLLYRNAGDGSDNLAVDAELIGVELVYGI